MNRAEIIAVLSSKQVNLSFTKQDGSVRRMEATLSDALIPKAPVSVLQEEKNVRKEGPENNVRVWDMEAASWRSFNISSLITFDGKNV